MRNLLLLLIVANVFFSRITDCELQRSFSRTTQVSRYWNVSILDFIGAKDDEVVSGDNWSYRTCKATVKLSPAENQVPAFYRPDALPITQPSVSKQCKKEVSQSTDFSPQAHLVTSNLFFE